MGPAVPEKVAGAQGSQAYSQWLVAIHDCNVGHKYLDIGVGTSYYLHHANLSADTQVALLDLNANSLEAAKRRFGQNVTPCVLHDIFEPLPSELGKFDLMNIFYFLHCLPGSSEDKCSIFEHLKRNLTENGCVYGANILGKDVKHNLFGKTILKFGNKDGFFHNMEDSKAAFTGGLSEHLKQVEVEVVGAIFMFKVN